MYFLWGEAWIFVYVFDSLFIHNLGQKEHGTRALCPRDQAITFLKKIKQLSLDLLEEE